MAIFFRLVFIFFLSISFAQAANPGAILSSFDRAEVTRDSEFINFGIFTTDPTRNISIYDSYLKGYAWSQRYGWISLNCANEVVNNCASNGDFKVLNNGTGTLSGYAWGQKTGWINFGPANSDGGVSIDPLTGEFSGFAWGQKTGWIEFGACPGASCVKTDWVPIYECSDGLDNDSNGLIDYPADSGCSSSTDTDEAGNNPPPPPPIFDSCPNLDGIQFGMPDGYMSENGMCVPAPQTVFVCSDHLDNDADGLVDWPQDLGCGSPQDQNEVNGEPDPVYACSDHIDNDDDGLIDYPTDNGCVSFTDNNEYNFIEQLNCIVLGNCPTEEIIPPVDTVPPVISPTIPPIVSPVQSPSDASLLGDIFSTIHFPSSITLPSGASSRLAAQLLAILGFLGALLTIPSPVIRSLTAFFYTNKRPPWGVVYNSVTKEPLDPAYVVFKDAVTGAEVETAITDIDGRYGFLPRTGTYSLVAHKDTYQFPSTRLAGKTQDEFYDDLYLGGTFDVHEKQDVIKKNIPLDPVGFDWNAYQKNNLHLVGGFMKRSHIIQLLSNGIYAIGFVFSIYAFLMSASLWNGIILGLYILFFFLRLTVFRYRGFGIVMDQLTHTPVAHALIKMYRTGVNELVGKTISDQYGRYYKLVHDAVYHMTVETLQSDGTYKLVHTSAPMDIKHGIINTKIVL